MRRALLLCAASFFLVAGCAKPQPPPVDPHKDCLHLYERGVDGQVIIEVAFLPTNATPPAPPRDQVSVKIEREDGENWSQQSRSDAWGCARLHLPGQGRFHATATHLENETCQWYDGSRFTYNGTDSFRLSYVLEYYCIP